MTNNFVLKGLVYICYVCDGNLRMSVGNSTEYLVLDGRRSNPQPMQSGVYPGKEHLNLWM